MSKIKWNYAVVRSLFGDLWIGKTKLKPQKEKIFADPEDAVEKAQQLFQDSHLDFDELAEPNDENYNDELLYEYEKLSELEDIEEIRKGLEKFMV